MNLRFWLYFGASVLAGLSWFWLVSWVVDHTGRRARRGSLDWDHRYADDLRERVRFDIAARMNGRR